MMYVPNNNNNMWTAIGMLTGGMMRDDYDQRGQAKALEGVQDLSIYKKNNDALGIMQSIVDAKTSHDNATDQASRDLEHQKAVDLYSKLGGYGINGLNSDSSIQDVQNMMKPIQEFNTNLQNKYQTDQRFNGMVAPGTVPTNPGDIINYYKAKTNKAIYGT